MRATPITVAVFCLVCTLALTAQAVRLSCEEAVTQLKESKKVSQSVKDAITEFFNPEVIEHEKRETSLRRICQQMAYGDEQIFHNTLARCKKEFDRLTSGMPKRESCIDKILALPDPDASAAPTHPPAKTALERSDSVDPRGTHKKYDDNIKCFSQLQYLIRKKPPTSPADASSALPPPPPSSPGSPGSPTGSGSLRNQLLRKKAMRDLSATSSSPPNLSPPPAPTTADNPFLHGPPIDMGDTGDETELLKLTYALIRSVSKSDVVTNAFFTPAADKQHIVDQFLVKVVYNIVRTTAIYHRDDASTFTAFAKLRSGQLFEGDQLKIGSKAFREILKEISTSKTRLFDRCDKVVYVLNSMDVALDIGRANYERRLAILRMVTRIVTSAFRVASAPIPVAGDLAVAFASATGDLLETLVTHKTDAKMRKLHVSGVLLTFFRSFIPRVDTPKSAAVAEKLGVTPVEYPRNDECDPLVKRMFHVIRLMLEDESDKPTTPVGQVMNLCMPKEKDLPDHLLRVKSLFKLLKTFVDLDVDISSMTATTVAARVGQYLKDNTASWNTMGSQIRTLTK